jgi:hypothetical protein
LVALITRTCTVRSRLLPRRWKAPGFEHAQQFHLSGERQRADFIEEQRAAVGRFELAFARLVRAGVGARFGAEEFGFDQLARQRAAIDRDEGTVPHRRIRMDDLGVLFLAGAVRAGDEHRAGPKRATWQASVSIASLAASANTSP